MYLFISILILITCILLALIVLVQNSKGGGLAANFSSQNQIMGVRKTADFLEKSTWTLAIVLLVLSLAAATSIPSGTKEKAIETQLSTEGLQVAPMNAINPFEQPVQEQSAE
ncbi:preprotein translocase subunit SecG [Bacteroidales bacterium OttesenSCG-928-C19]|nr:preprotein translocase subunit SecG [Bacteroidales bacterium OttesenSCG-928-C19]